MTLNKSISKFSGDCAKLAISSSDGRLLIWGNGAGGSKTQLMHQFSPSSHLSAVSTCLSWAATEGLGSSKKKKKKSDKEKQNDLIAMGTSAGTVLIYSIIQGDLVTTFKPSTSTSSKVNGIAWTKDLSSLYAAADDGSVHLCSIAQQELVSSFKPISQPIYSIAVNKDQTYLALGSRNIFIWDLSKKSISKKLTGHANPVSRLEIFDSFVFSSSESERILAVWKLDGKAKDSVLTLKVNQEVTDFEIVKSDSDATVSVLTREGTVSILNCSPKDGSSNTTKTLSVISGKDEPRRVKAVKMCRNSLHIAHGAGLDVTIEQIDSDSLEQDTCLVRESGSKKNKEEVSDVITPNTDGDVVFLAPGSTLGSGQNKRKDNKRKAEKEESLPMEERLSLLSTESSKDTAPRTDTLAQLLAQGLHSNDSRILDSVLDRADLDLIDKTVKKMPAEAVVPLVNVLQHYIKGRGVMNASHAKWLKAVLTIHTGYLVSVPDCQELLSPVYALLETRTQHYNQVLQLRGKLELLTRQTVERQGETTVNTDKQALLVYQDESSDELEDVIDDLLVPGSNSEDDWEEDKDDEDEEMEGEDSDNSIEIVNDQEMESDSEG